MLGITVTMDNNKVVIEGLGQFIQAMPGAIGKGLTRVGVGIYGLSIKNLDAEGAEGKSKYVTSKKTGKKYLDWTENAQAIPAGGYPVPIRTGWLKKMENWLKPGETKTIGAVSDLKSHDLISRGGSFTAGPMEAIVFNAALYSTVIHESIGSSAKFGPRRFQTDAFEKFNQGGKIREILLEEIMKVKK